MPKVMKVIECATHRGAGRHGDPFRIVTQYWTLDGETLLAESDPWVEQDSDQAAASRRSPTGADNG